MNGWFESDGLKLARYLARPPVRPARAQRPCPAFVLCHGFPVGPLDARQSAGTFPELVDRIANELGFVAMTFTFRGCGQSEGDFSLAGWQRDLRAADRPPRASTPTPTASGWPARRRAARCRCACAAEDPRRAGRRDARRPGRLRRLGRPAPPLPRARPRDRRRARRRASRPSSTSGRGSCAAAGRSTRPAASATGRCSCCTATTTTRCRWSTPACSPRPTAAPSCG